MRRQGRHGIVDKCGQFAMFNLSVRSFDDPVRGQTLGSSFSQARRPNFTRDPERHAVQPTGKRLGLADPLGPSEQDQEGCLKRIFGVLVMNEHPATNAKDEWTVAVNDRFEGQVRIAIAKFGQ
jgi:hypothetical protein